MATDMPIDAPAIGETSTSAGMHTSAAVIGRLIIDQIGDAPVGVVVGRVSDMVDEAASRRAVWRCRTWAGDGRPSRLFAAAELPRSTVLTNADCRDHAEEDSRADGRDRGRRQVDRAQHDHEQAGGHHQHWC